MLGALWMGVMLAAAPEQQETVLMFNLDAKSGVSKEFAETVTQYLAGEAAKRTRLRVVTYREVEGTLSADQLKQVAGCDSVSCAAEIAGALNSDQIVLGSLARVGDALVVTMSRVKARNATVVGRVTRRYKAEGTEVLDAMPDLVGELFATDLLPGNGNQPQPGNAAASPQGTGGTQTTNATGTPPPDGKKSGGMGALVLRVLGGVALGVGAVLLLPALAGAAVAAGIVGYDVSRAGLDRRRAITATVAVGADAAMVMAGVGFLAFVLFTVTGAAALGISLVL